MKRDMTITVCSDLHLHHLAPSSRLDTDDEWLMVQRKVLTQLLEQCSDLLVCAGDILHHPKPKFETTALLFDFFHEYYNVESFDIVSCVGNHDCFGNNTADVSPMFRLSHIRLLGDGSTWRQRLVGAGANSYIDYEFSFFGDSEEATIALLEEAKKPQDKRIAATKNGATREIAVVHATVGKGESPYWTNVEGLNFPYDMVVFGDIHEPFEYVCDNGCICVNTGSLIPRNINEQHQPKILLLHPTLTDWYSYQNIDVPSKGWRDVTKTVKNSAEVDFDKINEILEAQRQRKVSPEEVLMEIAKGMPNIENPKAIVNEVLQRTL